MCMAGPGYPPGTTCSTRPSWPSVCPARRRTVIAPPSTACVVASASVWTTGSVYVDWLRLLMGGIVAAPPRTGNPTDLGVAAAKPTERIASMLPKARDYRRGGHRIGTGPDQPGHKTA